MVVMLYTVRACTFGCRYQTCLIHATVHTIGCNTVKLAVYRRCNHQTYRNCIWKMLKKMTKKR